jgi:hypothetical protein
MSEFHTLAEKMRHMAALLTEVNKTYLSIHTALSYTKDSEDSSLAFFGGLKERTRKMGEHIETACDDVSSLCEEVEHIERFLHVNMDEDEERVLHRLACEESNPY